MRTGSAPSSLERNRTRPAAVTSLRDTVNQVRRFKAELEAIRPETLGAGIPGSAPEARPASRV
jgi:hypothetical protein